ncbi:ubiquinol-cytochrome c reductase iron-sulfur subunit [Chitinophaga sp. XS-30]|uniref:QcrA and Rieske domain-containing protein n=1 Tax=Chitinophaga sp. XS-30 TaxID=2604421 RepID=UPI0011DD01C4|nr:Rieske (2Fe-2S) protein [Chitinophaga sp. XS-30]QEH42626.1 Rieske (2Fe-2S) protein [Chitinophaga sp. XS-30]
MERRDFLSNMGITLVIACAGGIAACSKGGDTPEPAPNPNPNPNPNPGGARLTVNLNSQIPNIGDYIISSGVVLIRLAAGNVPASFSALTSTCTHEGCTLSNYASATQKIECGSSCGHGSRFNTDGTVSNGPATGALTKYTVEISGTTLTVK